MTILPGMENLQPCEVLSFTSDGHVVVKHGDSTQRYKLLVLPNGGLGVKPEQSTITPIDQLVARERTPLAHRHRGIDQLT